MLKDHRSTFDLSAESESEERDSERGGERERCEWVIVCVNCLMIYRKQVLCRLF